MRLLKLAAVAFYAVTCHASAQSLMALGLDSPAIQYDMTTVSGSTLTDISGNGNNGTLHGTTPGSLGISFNGTTDYISIPPLVKNSDFTVIVISTGDIDGGGLWYEGNSAQTSLMRMFRSASDPNVGRINSSGGDSGQFGAAIPSFQSEYHAYYIERAGSSAFTGLVELPYASTPVTIPGSPNFAGDTCAAIGAQSYGASCVTQNSFFSGTVAYFLLYTRALSTPQIQAAYSSARGTLANRGVYLQDFNVSLGNLGPIWAYQGVVITTGQEPSVLYDTNCQILSSPCFKMWYSAVVGEGYAESSDGMSWSLHGSPVVAVERVSVLKVGSTYYLYGEHSKTTNQAFDCYTSTDGLNWTLLQASVLVAGPQTYDNTQIDNPFVAKIGSQWIMLYEGNGSTSSKAQCNLALSSDGVNWVKTVANPITGYAYFVGRTCGGPTLYQPPTGEYYLYGGGNSPTNGNGAITRFQSPSLATLWAQSISSGVVYDNANTTSEIAVSDPSFVQVGGTTFMYYSQTTSVGGGNIGLATATLPQVNIVPTIEGRQ